MVLVPGAPSALLGPRARFRRENARCGQFEGDGWHEVAPKWPFRGSNGMMEIDELIRVMRESGRTLEKLCEGEGPLHSETGTKVAAALEKARVAVTRLAMFAPEPDDFEPETAERMQARTVEERRRILTNALRLASYSLFAAPDPPALRRDLRRAVRSLLCQADDEESLLTVVSTGQVA